MKKVFTILCLLIFLIHYASPCYAYLALDYLCELGRELYQQGRYTEALHQFQKVLLIQPDYRPALEYIRRIERQTVSQEEVEPLIVTPLDYNFSKKLRTIKDELDLIELEREATEEKEIYLESSPLTVLAPIPLLIESEVALKKPLAFEVIRLQDLAEKIEKPIEIEQGKTIILSGRSIKRFLVTQPNVLKVEKKDINNLLLTGNHIGYTYIHIWDQSERRTLELLTIPPKPKGPTLEEKMRLAEQRARNFRLSYSLDWASYESGRRINDLKRSNYFFIHNLGLMGETPYGDFDSALTLNRFDNNEDIGWASIGLTDARIGPFEDFSLRGLDFFAFPPDFSNLIFPGISLRGGMLESLAFNKKIDYTAFVGRENRLGFGGLSPGLTTTKQAYIAGFNLKYLPTPKQDYRFTFVHGWGEDREEELNPFGYDLSGSWIWNRWKIGSEVAHDSETLAHIFDLYYSQPRLYLGAELRNINKKFFSSTGSGWLQGELGGLFYLNYEPIDKLSIYANLNAYQDRLYPSLDNQERWNQDFAWDAIYRIDPSTTLRLDYSLRNELGRISQYRYQSVDLGISQTLKFIKDIYLFCNYYHQENDNFSTPSSSYTNERIYTGLRFNLTKNLYYYINKEFNWLNERYTADTTMPHALETGVDWSGQIGNSPWWGGLRFTYRDEEDASSSLSFLSGEDYIEGYSELSYRPRTNLEIFGSCRMRNVWADNPDTSKRFEASFNVGLRYLWDTGVKWDPIGNIDGFVFKDYNADGIMQRGEPPVEGVKVWLGKARSLITDIFGYFEFEKIRGRKLTVSLDTSTVPQGFVLTTPSGKFTDIRQGGTNRVFFGIIARSEISGFVFEDKDANGKYDKKDKGIHKVIITLEDGSRAITDDSGRYSFPMVAPGEHTISIYMNSLPIYYLPTVAVKTEITLHEGVTYNYNFPLKKSK